MSNKKRTYTSAFKTKIVLEALREDKSIAELSVKYNITPKNIHNWKATFLSNAEIAMEPSKCVAEYKQAAKELNQQVADYAKKVGELTMEKEFLEGKLRSLALSDRKPMIDAKHNLPINKQAELLSIARSTIYYKPVENTYKKSVLEKLKKYMMKFLVERVESCSDSSGLKSHRCNFRFSIVAMVRMCEVTLALKHYRLTWLLT